MWLKTEALELINLDTIAKISITHNKDSLVLNVVFIDSSVSVVLSNIPSIEEAEKVISYIYDAMNQNVRILDVAMISPVLKRK